MSTEIYTEDGIKILDLDYMRTREAQYKGLQYADPLPWYNGLLFPTRYGTGYHMHNVRYAIDICFIDDDGEILQITPMEPEYGGATAPARSKWAVETNPGFWRSNGLGVGSRVYIRGT